MIRLQIARDKEEHGDGRSLHIPEIEPFLRLWQVAEHHAAHCNGLGPVYPVNTLFHPVLLLLSLAQIVKNVAPVILRVDSSIDGNLPPFTL